ncbi:hypothetical protein D3C75_1358010 [compost metagenome]
MPWMPGWPEPALRFRFSRMVRFLSMLDMSPFLRTSWKTISLACICFFSFWASLGSSNSSNNMASTSSSVTSES